MHLPRKSVHRVMAICTEYWPIDHHGGKIGLLHNTQYRSHGVEKENLHLAYAGA